MTHFAYKGKYNGDPESLPAHVIEPSEVQYREPEDLKKLSFWMNLLALVLTVPLFAAVILRAGGFFATFGGFGFCVGAILSVVSAVPHEFIHGLCFPGEVEMYQNLKQGMLFVTGAEEMSRGRFVFMSLAPNVLFGLLPFLLFLLFPRLIVLGALGACAIPMGMGDYMNVFNTLRQVPAGCPVYMRGFHTYWYDPKANHAADEEVL